MVSFVILNYKSINDTIECIESIKKIQGNKSIVVVDNNSMALSDKEQLNGYDIDLILLNENLGFAKGNNAGCKFAIKKYNPDFLCVINSDTLIEQIDFLNKISELYNKYSFDILGPKILPEESDSCNPFPAYQTLEKVESQIRYTQKIIKIYENIFLRYMLVIYMKLKSLFIKKAKMKNGDNDAIDVALHGCALIFSKKYYDKFDDIFFPGTFLFHEEEFLLLRCRNNKLTSLYSPSIMIYHKEGQSVKKEFKGKKYNSILFRNREILKSLKLLSRAMKNEENEDVNI